MIYLPPPRLLNPINTLLCVMAFTVVEATKIGIFSYCQEKSGKKIHFVAGCKKADVFFGLLC